MLIFESLGAGLKKVNLIKEDAMIRRIIFLTALYALVSAFLIPPAMGARLVSLQTCRQVAGQNNIPKGVTDRFTADVQAIHAVAMFDKFRSGTLVKGTWISVDAVDSPNYTIDSFKKRVKKKGEVNIHFSLSKPTKGWPTGKYRFELYMGKTLISTADFTITAASQKRAVKKRSAGRKRPKVDKTTGVQKQAPNNLQEGQGRSKALIGCWQCQKDNALVALIFHTPDILSQDGEQFQYTLIPGTIRVSNGYQYADYRYQTDGQQLAAVYPDGSQIYCVRAGCATLVSTGSQSNGRSSGGQASGEQGNEMYAPDYGGSGSWETEGDRQYYDDSAGYGGGAYENPDSGYYDYNNE